MTLFWWMPKCMTRSSCHDGSRLASSATTCYTDLENLFTRLFIYYGIQSRHVGGDSKMIFTIFCRPQIKFV